MSTGRRRPGEVRDAIVKFLSSRGEASVAEIRQGVSAHLGGEVAASSIRSYLNLNTPTMFERTGRGRYRLSGR